jgi:hypothetical protein
MAWSEQQRIEFQAPEYLRNIIRIITESGLRVYKELMPMKKEQVDLENAGRPTRTDRVLSRRRSIDGVLSRFCHGRRGFGSIQAGRTVSEIGKVV